MTSSTQRETGRQYGIAWLRLGYLFITLIVSVVLTYFVPCYIDQMSKLLQTAIGVFAIFTGFSMTLIGIIGGMDSVLHLFSWQQLQSYRSTFHGKIIRQAIICSMYALALCLALVLLALDDKTKVAYLWVARGFVFFASYSLLASLAVPFHLYDLYTERYELLLTEKGAPKIDDPSKIG